VTEPVECSCQKPGVVAWGLGALGFCILLGLGLGWVLFT
jgi:hypothetical protein